MAKGKITGKKIVVTGFTPSETTEEIYRVTASGRSTAEASSGAKVTSNQAIVRHEKSASITLRSAGGGKIIIIPVNIREDTLAVTEFPGFVGDFYISGNTLFYSTNPAYDGPSSGTFVVSALDIYGNAISASITVSVDASPRGSITLSEPSGETTPETTSVTLTYVLDSVTPESVILATKSGEGLSVLISTGSSEVILTFGENMSKDTDRVFSVSVSGTNTNGDRVVSNTVSVIQGKSERTSGFYLTGDDIPWDSVEAFLTVHIPSSVDLSTVGVVSWSGAATGASVEDDLVRVLTTPNEDGSIRDLTVTVTASTRGGKVLVADGSVFQNPKDYLLICGVTAYTRTDNIKASVRNLSFTYTSMGVTGITATGDPVFLDADGKISLGSGKTVRLSFLPNGSAGNRTFVITLKGTDTSGAEHSATYTVTQDVAASPDFILYSGNTGTTSVTIPAASATLSLGLVCPTFVLPGSVKVYRNTASGSARLAGITVSADRTSVSCSVPENKYGALRSFVLSLCGKTDDGKTVYSNDFTVNQEGPSGSASITLSPTGGTVGSGATSLNFARTTTGVFSRLWYVVTHLSGGGWARVESVSGNTWKVSVDANYGAETRQVTVTCLGIAADGSEVSSNTMTVTQDAGGGAGITVTPSSVEMPDPGAGNVPEFQVVYNNVTPLTPQYDSVFEKVSDTGAFLNTPNDTMTPKTHTITFRGRKNDNPAEKVSAVLTVTQPGSEPDATLKISSGYVDKDLPLSGGSYPLNVTYEGINPSTIGLVCDSAMGPLQVTLKTESGNRYYTVFADAGGGGAKAALKGILSADGKTISIPIGNDNSGGFFPRLLVIHSGVSQDGTSGGEYFEYEAKLSKDSGDLEIVSNIYLTATTISGSRTISSNVLSFKQKGNIPPTPSEQEDDGGEYQMRQTYYQHNRLTGESGEGPDYFYSVFADKRKPEVLGRTDLEIDPATWSVKSAIRRYSYDNNHGRGGYYPVPFTTGDTPTPGTGNFWLCTTRYNGDKPIERWRRADYAVTVNIFGYFFKDYREPPDERDYGKRYTIISGMTTGGVPVSYRYEVQNSVAYIEDRPTYTSKDRVPDVLPISGGNVTVLFGYRGVEDDSTSCFRVEYEDDSDFESYEILDRGTDEHIGSRQMDNTYGDWKFVGGVKLRVAPEDGYTTECNPWSRHAKKYVTVFGTPLDGGPEVSGELMVLQEMANYVRFSGATCISNFKDHSSPPSVELKLYFEIGEAIDYGNTKINFCYYNANSGNWDKNKIPDGTKVSLYGPVANSSGEWEWITDNTRTLKSVMSHEYSYDDGKFCVTFKNYQQLYRSNLDNKKCIYNGRLITVFEFKDSSGTRLAWEPVTIYQHMSSGSKWAIETGAKGGFPY